MTMITPSYLGETIEYSSLHACRSTLEDPTGLALVLAISYWLLMTIFVAMGAAAVLPASLAAWAANILFLAGALYLVLTVRT